MESEEAEDMKSWTVLQLLNAIKAERDARKKPEGPDDDIDVSLSRRVGCEHI